MIKMFNYFKLKNLEDELKQKEEQIRYEKFDMLDLKELEEISNKIMTLQLEMAGVKLELN